MDLDADRRWGYLRAQLDSLGRLAPAAYPESGESSAKGREIYCGSIGAEFMHLPQPERRQWIQERMELPPPIPDRRGILDLLLRADTFEKFLQYRYIGTKRYSLEGAESLLPLLVESISRAADRGAREIVLGMSHRGRLNVMVHVVGKTPAEILTSFEDVDPESVLGGGDVKYHWGASGSFAGPGGTRLALSLTSNPSHLEAVDPVVLGRVRAKQDALGAKGRDLVLPILIHGDAAFAGQGILAETLNLADLPAYHTGGAVHIIVNNLIGFTTPPAALHSSRYASDLAKRVPIPVFHVNGEDPDAVMRTARLATEYRFAFRSDVVVDLISYRRHGHSEVDDPTITQPLLYERIKARRPIWVLYAEASGLESPGLIERVKADFEKAYDQARSATHSPALWLPNPQWNEYRGGRYDPSLDVGTGVDPKRLREISERVTAIPPGFSAHPKVREGYDRRRRMGRGELPVDWGMAEALGFGSLLSTGVPVRLTGEDTRRGTFNHRHSVLIDSRTEEEFFPLKGLGSFECYDSPLSEASAVGFEFGYSLEVPQGLVLWEAQFGDFANGAQVILDQYLAAAEDKWGLLSGLVLLLPHGYEGQGAEHSSARIERFLQLAAEDNLQLCQPSTAAQYFHLLRRQALQRWRKPLVVFTPKGMLRHPRASSLLQDFSKPSFRSVLGHPSGRDARRMIVCSGRIGHDLAAERERRGDQETALVFLEQLYPFPERELEVELHAQPGGAELVWVQEEPGNMGALNFVLPRLQRMAGARRVRSVRRSESASPATGSMKAHAIEQATLLELAFMEG